MRKSIILIILYILLTACSHQVHYKDTGLHYDRLGYKTFLVGNSNTHHFDEHGTVDYIYDVYVKNKKRPVVKSLRLAELAIIHADRADIYTKSVSGKDRLDSIDFDYKYDTKKKTVRCVLKKTKKVPMKGKICIAVFDESRNVVNAKEFNIKDQMKQEVTWRVYQEFTYATCIARVYKVKSS